MLSIAWMMFRLMKLEFHHAHHRRSAAQKASPTVGSTPLPASLPPSSSSLPRPAQRCGHCVSLAIPERPAPPFPERWLHTAICPYGFPRPDF